MLPAYGTAPDVDPVEPRKRRVGLIKSATIPREIALRLEVLAASFEGGPSASMVQRVLFSLIAFSAALLAQGKADWHRPFPAFKIAGNLYYVGTADLAVYLVNTPQGNILINSDFEQDVPLIRNSIEHLGFKYRDTKIVLISHAHGDHDAATRLLKSETGAKLMVMAADVSEEESTARGRPGAHVDRVLYDGDTVELGGLKLTARLTPGHTKGCTTWTMQVP